MDKNTNTKCYQLFLMLKEKSLTFQELSLILSEDNPSKILRAICSSLRYYVEDVKELVKLPNDLYITNLKETINGFLPMCCYDIGSSLRSLKNIECKINKCACKKELFVVFEEIQNDLLGRLSFTFQNHKFEFLVTLIEETHNINYLKYVLNTFPHYINIRDKTGRPIILYYLDKILSLLDADIFDKELLYYHSVASTFMKRERFHMSDTATQEYLKIMSTRIESLSKRDSHYKEKIGYYQCYIHYLAHYDVVRKNMDNIDVRYGIRVGFNDQIQQELSEILRKDYIITIDSEDTADMDDALSIQRVNDHYHLKVYITNIADIIKMNSHIDLEAYERAETLYYANIPMFPSELSNSVCSLNTFFPKSVFEFSVDIYDDGKIGNFKINKKFITVSKNYTFKDVDRILNNDEEDPYDTLASLSSVAEILRNHGKDKLLHRSAEELINYGHWIIQDKSTYKHRTRAEIIIEETMILINFLIADYFERQGYPFIYRVHDEPSDSAEYNKLMRIKDMIKSEYTTKDEYMRIIDVLMNMYPKAYYSLNNHKHFGLGIYAYSHSTSPIRRFPDVVVQRLINDYVFSAPSLEKDQFWIPKIEEISDHCNEQMKNHFAHQEERSKMKVLTMDY